MSEAATPGPSGRGFTPLRYDWRLILVMGCICLCYAAVALNMTFLAASEPEEPRFGKGGTASPPIRGEIVDQNGVLLASNLPAWSLYAHPHEIRDKVAVSEALAEALPGSDARKILRKLTSNAQFVWIKRPILPHEKQAVHELGQPGLYFGNREIRVYPAGRTASHVVGGVTAAREDVRFAELAGNAGVERHFDQRLRDPGQVTEPLRLSLDVTVQQAMRSVLAEGMERLTAKGASAVLMRTNGEVVGLVSLPDFDPNRPRAPFDGPAHEHPRFNRAAQGLYELGSTFKVFTAAIALELSRIDTTTLIDTPPMITYGRNRIRDAHKMPPQMPVETMIVKSSNVGAARIGMMVGTTDMKTYLDKLGFFEPTGVEISEAGIQPLLPQYWTDLSTMTISFGHGLSVSPMHLAAGYATLANDGMRVQPTLIAGAGGKEIERVFSQRTARLIRQMMREVVKRGTARRAEVAGYRVAGKTGTAEKIRLDRRGYDPDRVVATFASIFPYDRPEYVLVVTYDEPTDRSGPRPERGAGRTAAPVAGEMIARVAPLLGLEPDLTPPSGTDQTIEIGRLQ